MSNRRVDYNAIVTQKTLDGRIEALENEVKSAGYVCVTDAISHYGHGGSLMIERLQRDNVDKMPTGDNRKFKIFVMRDEWGTVPKPGDVVTREITRPLKDKAGRKLRSTAKNDMIRRGLWKKNYVLKREFPVDDKGCIEVTVDDALFFLQNHGVHFEDNGAALCGRREVCGSQCKAPGGQMKTVWYWRYYEAPPWVYEQLPSLAKPKRTRSTKKTEPTKVHSSPATIPGDTEI